jgi:hypothetical protein
MNKGAKIALNKYYYILCDPEDEDYIRQYKWSFTKTYGKYPVVYRNIIKDNKKTTVNLGRDLLKPTAKQLVQFYDNDPTNVMRTNMYLTNRSELTRNNRPKINRVIPFYYITAMRYFERLYFKVQKFYPRPFHFKTLGSAIIFRDILAKLLNKELKDGFEVSDKWFNNIKTIWENTTLDESQKSRIYSIMMLQAEQDIVYKPVMRKIQELKITNIAMIKTINKNRRKRRHAKKT